MRGRTAAWLRWVARPWRSAGLITALIASFALPAFVAASADVFLISASDSITRQVLDDQPTSLDVTIVAGGRLTSSGVTDLDAAVRDQFDQIGRLDAPRRIVYADLALQRPGSGDAAPAETIIGSSARVIASDGAIGALEVVDAGSDADGLWISERLSDRLDLVVGTEVSIDGSPPIAIAGVFTNLWEGDRDPYWDDLPSAFVPRFSPVLSAPLFETMIVPESVLVELAPEGLIRWDAEVRDRPDSYRELTEQATRTRNVERSYTQSPEMARALAGFAGAGAPSPVLTSGVFDVSTEVEQIVAELDQPIATAATGGIVLGLLVTAAGAAFAVRKRESEARLLRADGDAGWRFAARSIAQFAAPAVIGAVVGVAAAWFLIAAPGDGVRPSADVIDIRSIAWVTAIGLGVAAVITGAASSRVLDASRSAVNSLRLAWFLPIVGLVAAAWIQVGADGNSAEVDPLVIAFPLVGLIAGVGLIVIAVRWLMGRVHRSGGSLPPALFFAWRRITAAESSATLLSAALGISLGLIVFSTSLVAALDDASVAKATTAVGGETQARVDGRFDAPLPPDTTLVLVLTTRSTVGRDVVNVVAIDPASYASGVSWHPAFGSSPAEIVELVDQPVDADVAAVISGPMPAPMDAGFGTTHVTSYTAVATIDAAPLTSEVYPTLLVSAERVDAAARRDHEARRPAGVSAEEWDAEFRSPLQRARPVLISQLDAADLAIVLDDSEITVTELTTVADQRDQVGNRAARWTFEYMSLLALVAGLAALGALLFYLSDQRANRQLSSVMAERMGLRRRSAAGAAVGEVLGLVLVALAAGTSVGLGVAKRVFDRFEPVPRLPPDLGLRIPWVLVGTIGAAATIVVVLAALGNEWLASRRSYAEVLRGT